MRLVRLTLRMSCQLPFGRVLRYSWLRPKGSCRLHAPRYACALDGGGCFVKHVLVAPVNTLYMFEIIRLGCFDVLGISYGAETVGLV